MNRRNFWRTKFGFYLAAIGSALGLGNLWRFPYVVGENGGGAFVLMYIFIAMTIGMTVLIAELILGKSKRKSVLHATKELGSRIRWVGVGVVLLTLFVFSYYAVISGWVLHFVVQFIFKGFFGSADAVVNQALKVLMDNGWLQVGLASVHLLVCVLIIGKGVQEGLERWMGVMMPLFSIFLLILVVRSMSLPSTVPALRFLFYPDFSKLTMSSLIQAVGHSFFTLSIGFGVMVTFGRYMNENDHVPSAGVRVAVVDTIISLAGILIIFPIALGASNIKLSDPTLLFEALPRFLLEMKGGVIFGTMFFMCLYLAALAASIGLFEVIVSNVMDTVHIERDKAAWMSGLAALVMALFPALSSSNLRITNSKGQGLIEIVDGVLINWILPIIALFLTLAISRGFKERKKYFVDQNKIVSVLLYPHWEFVLSWVVPGVIILAFVLEIAGQLFKI